MHKGVNIIKNLKHAEVTIIINDENYTLKEIELTKKLQLQFK